MPQMLKHPRSMEWELLPFNYADVDEQMRHYTVSRRLPDLPEKATRYAARITVWFNDEVVATLIAHGTYDSINLLRKRMTAGQGWSTVCTWYYAPGSDGAPNGTSHSR